MRKIYLVKKNPKLAADGSNWIVMNGYEFAMFMQTPEGQRRKDNFGQLDACTMDDVIIVVECGADTAKVWRSEKDSHDYLAAAEKESGFTVFSYSTQTTTDDEGSGEELLEDKTCDVAEEVMKRLQKVEIQDAIAKLLPAERALIESLFFTECPLSEREYARKLGKTQSTINYQKVIALKHLKKLLQF